MARILSDLNSRKNTVFIASRSLPQKVKIKEIQNQFWSCSACATFSMPTNLDENPDNRRTKKEVHDPFGFTWREIEGRVNNHKGPLCLMRSPSFHTFLYMPASLYYGTYYLGRVTNSIFCLLSLNFHSIQARFCKKKENSHEAIKNRSLEKEVKNVWWLKILWLAKSHDNYKLIWSLEP